MCLQQPPTQALLERVQSAASNRLLDLPQHEVIVAHSQLMNRWALLGSKLEMRQCNPARSARKLDDRLADSLAGPERRISANDASASESGRFYHGTIGHRDDD